MTHQAVLVLVPDPLPSLKTTEGKMLAAMIHDQDLRRLVELEVERMLRPYRVGTEVEPYREPCECIGLAARLDVLPILDAQFGTLAEMDRAFRACDPMPEEPPRDTAGARRLLAWRERYERYFQARAERAERLLAAHPQNDKPDPLCLECGGSGERTATRNPNGRYEQFVIGGQYAGALAPARPHGHPAAFGSGTVRPASDVRGGLRVDAVVTPDGEWCDLADWGRVNQAHEPAEVGRYLADAPQTLAVIVDCYRKTEEPCSRSTIGRTETWCSFSSRRPSGSNCTPTKP